MAIAFKFYFPEEEEKDKNFFFEVDLYTVNNERRIKKTLFLRRLPVSKLNFFRIYNSPDFLFFAYFRFKCVFIAI